MIYVERLNLWGWDEEKLCHDESLLKISTAEGYTAVFGKLKIIIPSLSIPRYFSDTGIPLIPTCGTVFSATDAVEKWRKFKREGKLFNAQTLTMHQSVSFSQCKPTVIGSVHFYDLLFVKLETDEWRSVSSRFNNKNVDNYLRCSLLVCRSRFSLHCTYRLELSEQLHCR